MDRATLFIDGGLIATLELQPANIFDDAIIIETDLSAGCCFGWQLNMIVIVTTILVAANSRTINARRDTDACRAYMSAREDIVD